MISSARACSGSALEFDNRQMAYATGLRRSSGDHHRRGVNQRADRGWAFHSVGKPDVKGELGRLAHSAYEYE